MDCQPLVHWRRWQRAVEESSKGKRCGGERPWCLRDRRSGYGLDG